MASKTDNFGLTKPALTDPADIQVLNANMDIIDSNMKTLRTQINNLKEDLHKLSDDVTNITANETGGFSNEIVTFSQENDTVKKFIAEAQEKYTDNDDYSSVVGKYCGNGSTNYQYPTGYNLTIPKDGTLLIMNESTGKGFEVEEVSSGSKTIYNLIPGDTYTYILKDTSGVTYASGRVKATGDIRMLKIPNTWNFRDLGGWKCNGGTVKYGKLLRGGALSGGTPISNYANTDGMRAIRDFGILQEVDLRGDGETDNGTSDKSDDINSCPAGEYIHYNRYSISSDLNTSADNQKLIGQVLRLIMSNVVNDIPTYYHCAAGADRTGIISIALLAFLGVSIPDIEIDYELTAFYSVRSRTQKKSDFDYLKSFNGNKSGIDWKAAVFGEQIGVPVSEINAFRKAMIDGNPETLSVPTKLQIIKQPANVTTKQNVAITNSIEAIGDSVTYAWEYRTSASGTWASVANIGLTANTNQISIPANAVTMDVNGWQIRCTVRDEHGNNIVSNVATLTVAEETYTVTNKLTHCTSNNTSTAVTKGGKYSATITPNSSYQINSLTVTMGGKDITSTAVSGGKINISEITGDIIIFCNATKIDQGLVSTSLATDLSIYNGIGYKNGIYLSGTDEHTDASATTIGWIKIDEDSISNTWTVTGADSSSYAASHSRINVGGANNNDTSITLLTQQNGLSGDKAGLNFTTLDDGSLQMTQTTKLVNSFHRYDNYYFRLCFANTDGANVSIKFKNK